MSLSTVAAYVAVFSLSITRIAAAQDIVEYVCFPCGAECDLVIHDNEGVCSECKMPLIEKERVNFKTLLPEEVSEIISNQDDYILLDVRTPAEYDGIAGDSPEKKAGHIIGAINIPHSELSERAQEIEQYKDKRLIVYCSHSHRSPYASQILTDLGFTEIYNMAEGLSYWVEKDIRNSVTGESLLVK
jgi:rhodanese-related sulfurtransferase